MTMSDQNNILPEEFIYSKEVVEFITVANDFCILIEDINSFSREEFIENIYKLLIILQVKTIMVPKPDSDSDSVTESFVNEADWNYIDTAVSSKLGNFEIFSDLREPAEPETIIEISLSECLADIYQDLKDITQLYHVGNIEAITQGLVDCITNYEQFWGPRLTIVIKEFHLLVYGEKDLSEENNDTEKEYKKGDSWLNDLFEN